MDKTNRTIEAYNQCAEVYAQKYMDFSLYADITQEFITLLNPGSKILDLGCGPGNIGKKLENSGKSFSITGIDLSERMIDHAKKNVSSGTFWCQDIREVNFPEATFDVIFLSFCIVHLNTAEANILLQKVAKFLKANGKIYLSFMEGKPEKFETTSFSKEEIYFNYYSASDIEAILIKTGIIPFKVIKQGYPEADGTVTTDVFIFAEK